MKRCFVISPIGAEGSDVREHSNDVYDYIITPAMQACDIQAYRSDHLREPGKISDQMFREIYMDDLSIAVLTGRNPNVFYELALAHAARKPVIVLLQKGEILPFDISDLRCVYYDLKPRSLMEQVHVKEIIAHVHALERAGWVGKSPFESFLDEENARRDETYTCYPNPRNFSHEWMRLLKETEKTFEIMGIHLGPWRGGSGYVETLVSKADAGCKVRLMLMHEDNPTLAETINDRIPEVNLKMILREIEENTEFYFELARKHKGINVRRIRQGMLHCQTTRTDQCGVYVPYLFSRRRRNCPIWHCTASSLFYEIIRDEFEALWHRNAPKANENGVANPKPARTKK